MFCANLIVKRLAMGVFRAAKRTYKLPLRKDSSISVLSGTL